ncbi:hypothetical protein BS78_04G013600 [Paspalum vaginatum]|nr:hypothetical protein BS78_04G013600 [Paspalum vaginatum]
MQGLTPPMPAATASGTTGGGGRALDCRSLWKAGAYEASAAPNRDFFQAIAELLDNAVDEITNGATFIKVDKSINLKDNSLMLVFQDDGGGMDPEGLRRCMSLGFSTKKSNSTIGQYGNGFKTGTMRLGSDAIVFTRANHGSDVTLSIGLLSYTFLRRTMKDDIVAPMLDFQIQDGDIVPLLYGSQGDWDGSLKIMLDWSPFSSEEELLEQAFPRLAARILFIGKVLFPAWL